MKRLFPLVPAFCLSLMLVPATTRADDLAGNNRVAVALTPDVAGQEGACQEGACDGGLDGTGYAGFGDAYNWCYGPGGWFGQAEVTFFRYGRADGARMGSTDPGEDAPFDFEASPRLTLGYMGDDGFGARLRYWDYSHSAASNDGPDSALIVDTYTIDAELFQVYCVNPCTRVIVSGGVRYNEFEEVMIDTGSLDFRQNEFSGWGGILGAELWRSVTCHGSVYATTRAAMLMDDKFVFNADGNNVGNNEFYRDSVQGMFEIGLGYQYLRPLPNNTLFMARAGAEWQNWYNYSSSFNPDDEDEFAGPSDVGFAGFVFGIGFMR